MIQPCRLSWIKKKKKKLPKGSTFYSLWAGKGMFSISNLQKSTAHMCVVCSCFVCGRVQKKGEKLHCDLLLHNLAVLTLASCDQSNSPKTLEFSVKKKVRETMLQNKTLCICQYITHAAFWCSAAVHPLPSFGFVKEISLVCSLCTSGEGSIKEGGGLRGLGGRLATGRHLTPRLASAHCCQPSSNQQPSMRLAAEGVWNQPLAPS